MGRGINGSTKVNGVNGNVNGHSTEQHRQPLIILDQERVLVGDLTVDLARRSMTGRNRLTISLSSFEFTVLATLIKYTGSYVTRTDILRALIGDDEGDDNLVDIYVGYLRHKLVETASAVTIDRSEQHDYKLSP